jgi:mannose-1-phosphate guanylyltransferase
VIARASDAPTRARTTHLGAGDVAHSGSHLRRSPHIGLARRGGTDEVMPTEPQMFRVSSTPPVEDKRPVQWTVALAGGEGARLQDDVAKLNQLTPPSHTLTVIDTNHKSSAMTQLCGASDHVFCQPLSRDTGVALYVALAMIKRWNPNATVTITPTDHYVEPRARYLHHVQVARNIATRARELVVLLGVRPTEPDPDLGYVRLGERLTDVPTAHRVVGFIEKPSRTCAVELVAGGALWNTMVTCATVEALWSLGRSTQPQLMRILDCLVPLIGTPDESDAIEYIYRAYMPINFSRDMLTTAPMQLAVVELSGVEWSDGGRPGRVETVVKMRRNGPDAGVALIENSASIPRPID